ncbi:metal-dependent phosphohydrolase [Vibrio albus]|uniref:Metal-dependent phosphohydrolase n=1 Tax=Vibrio albus TaxID=2200953 RepID=A0A2U3B678_9VIBR|nr:HD domain-containing phosphohydrolase [Vibrio albus]PWI32301.1 metal-dependent phosphohydrolase [Vibrio albus]
MVNKLKQTRFSMRLTVISLFIVLSSLIIIVALSLQYYFSQSLAKESANMLFKSTAQNISEKVYSLDSASSDLTLLLSGYSEVSQQAEPESLHPITKVMARAMEQKPYLYSIYIGYQNGNLYELINLNSGTNLREKINATPADRWLIIHIRDTPSGRVRESRYFDAEFRLTHEDSEASRYRANVRPWYRDAMNSHSTIKTEPYIFHVTRSPGVTYAKHIPGSQNVIAVDISLDTFSQYLRENQVIEGANTLIFNQNGTVYAHSFSIEKQNTSIPVSKVPLSREEQKYIRELGVLKVSNEKNWPPFDFAYGGEPQGYSIDLLNLIAQKLGLDIEYSNGYDWNELVTLFKQQRVDVLHSVFYSTQRESWGLFSSPYLKLSPVLVTSENSDQDISLEQLNNGQVVAIPKGWAFVKFVQKHYPEIKILEVPDSLAGLKAVQNNEAVAAFDNTKVIEYLIDRYSLKGLALHHVTDTSVSTIDQQLRFLVHNDQPELKTLLNKAIASLTKEEKQTIDDHWSNDNSSAKLRRAINSGVVPTPVFTVLAVQSQQGDVIARNIMIGEKSYTLFVHHIPSEELGTDNYLGIMVPTTLIQQPYMEKVRFSLLITLGFLVLLTPALFLFTKMIATPVRLLANENEKIIQRKFNEVRHIPSQIKEINDLSYSIFSMAGSIEEYQRNQQELMDAFIKLIAQAIDDKSPYTGGHCERVPELAIMLAESAEKSDLPAFKDFKFQTAEQQRQFKIAAWLHDCGKVTSPEHIIDKGSKLETIHNRLHEIRTRFEVLWRDAEIIYWKGIVSGRPESELRKALSERHEQIKDDFAFIAQCNVGSEYMDEQDIKRISHIAQQTWLRHLDNRIGLSPQESKYLESVPATPLPAEEHVLADLKEHMIPWTRSPKDKIGGVKMDIPEHQSNLGEIYNLSIQKGTLTQEDRYRINEHIISTIQMLEALPLPGELSRVPEIAGGHHETLDGTGYPRKLAAEQLSMEARILAIADVFEALTASDRPYKKPKTLSEAITILSLMVKEEHLDEDLFRLLLSSNIHKQYASRFLNTSQNDEVDLSKYL